MIKPGTEVRMGRPPKKPEEVRGKFLRVRLTEDERKAIEVAASRHGFGVSAWLRLIVLDAAARML